MAILIVRYTPTITFPLHIVRLMKEMANMSKSWENSIDGL